MELSCALLILAGLAVKHAICDFALQTKWMIDTKGTYCAAGGLVHAALHGLGSGAVLVWSGASWGLIAALIGAEILAHYHIDYAKERLAKRLGHGPSDTGFWVAIGLDQMLHQLWYIGMVAVLAARLPLLGG